MINLSIFFFSYILIILTILGYGLFFEKLIYDKKNIGNIKRIFSKEYEPYEIGYISKEKSKFNIFGKLQW